MEQTTNYTADFLKVSTDTFDAVLAYCCSFGGLLAFEMNDCYPQPQKKYKLLFENVNESRDTIFVGHIDENDNAKVCNFFTNSETDLEVLGGIKKYNSETNEAGVQLMQTLFEDLEMEKPYINGLYVYKLTAYKFMKWAAEKEKAAGK